jgi:hypothetical protein
MTPNVSRISARPAGKTGTPCATPAAAISRHQQRERLPPSIRAQPLHADIVILIPAVDRALQRKLFRAALAELAVVGEPVNRVLEADLDGHEVTTLTLYGWPSGDTHSGGRYIPLPDYASFLNS